MAKNIITSLSDISQNKLKQLNEVGLNTAMNILQYVPRRYIFWNEPVTNMSVLTKEDHKNIVLKLKVCKRRDINKGIMYSCVDEKQTWVNVFIFYSRYINFSNGDYIWFYGTAKYNFEYKNWSMSASAHRKANEISIEPVYSKIKGMSTEYLGMVIRAALKDNSVKEYISSDIRISNNIMDIQAAYNIIHFPKDRLALNHAMRRYIFDVLYEYVSVIDSGIVAKEAIPLNVSSLITWNMIKTRLPFSLTGSQNDAVKQLVFKLASDEYINTLIQGDVGSGKTMLALFAASVCVDNNKQCAVLAPTEVLAKQHYEEFSGYLGKEHVVFLGGSTKVSEKKEINKRLENGEPLVVVGTHAIIQKTVKYTSLSFVVIDEQHRFGLEQRAALMHMKPAPHLMIMSATPIPRTMAEAAYGDQIDVINIQKPAIRLPVKTASIRSTDVGYESIYNEVLKGHQAYIICPLIEESESERMNDVQSVSQEENSCNKYFRQKHPDKNVRIVSINGKMKKEEIEIIINDFKAGKYDILISTTIIEVGVNVPNTTVILIRNSERFVLATLHQLRGRVGRSNLQSYCLLQSEKENERNEIMCKTNDGYEIAQYDLQLRGPGNFLSSQQSGFSKQMQMMLAYPDIYQLAKKFIIIDRIYPRLISGGN